LCIDYNGHHEIGQITYFQGLLGLIARLPTNRPHNNAGKSRIDWAVTLENMREHVSNVAPDYWDALVATPCAVVRMTPLLYLLLDWNNSTRCLVVRDLLRVEISKHCYSLENITMSLKWLDWMEK
jgi:hypothetical protein